MMSNLSSPSSFSSEFPSSFCEGRGGGQLCKQGAGLIKTPPTQAVDTKAGFRLQAHLIPISWLVSKSTIQCGDITTGPDQ